MLYTSSYLKRMKQEVFNVNFAQMNENMESVCYRNLEKHRNRICEWLKKCKVISDGNLVIDYKSMKILKEERKTYNKIIPALKKVADKLDSLSLASMGSMEYKTLQVYLEEIEKTEYILAKYSVKKLQRIFNGDKIKPIDLEVLMNTFYIPQFKEREFACKQYYIVTKKFIQELKLQLNYNRLVQSMEIAANTEPKNVEECQKLLRMVLNNLLDLDSSTSNDNLEERVWQVVAPIINAAMNQSEISEEKFLEVKRYALSEIFLDFELYSKMIGSNNVLENNGFKSVMLYHFYHRMLIMGENDCNRIWNIISDKIYRKSIQVTRNIIHPKCDINAPCLLNGTNIFIGKRCSIGENSLIKDNVTVMGLGESISENQKDTIIGKGVVIKERVFILPGSSIGDRCIIENDCSIDGFKTELIHTDLTGRDGKMNEEQYSKLYKEMEAGNEL